MAFKMKGSPMHSGTSLYKSALKHAGHGKGIGMKHHKGRAQEFDIEKQVLNDGATGKRYGYKVYGEEGSKLRKKSTKLAKAKKKQDVKAYNPGRYGATRSGERWSPGSLIRKNRVKNLQKRVDRIDDHPSKEYLAEQARQRKYYVKGSF